MCHRVIPKEYVTERGAFIWRVIKGERSRSKRLRTERRSLSLLTLCLWVTVETIVPASCDRLCSEELLSAKSWRNKTLFNILIAGRDG